MFIYRVSEKDCTFLKNSVVWWAPSSKLLCPRERRVFQSKLGVSSSNQCKLHHSPHTGHLEKKRVQSFSDTLFYGLLKPVLCHTSRNFRSRPPKLFTGPGKTNFFGSPSGLAGPGNLYWLPPSPHLRSALCSI